MLGVTVGAAGVAFLRRTRAARAAAEQRIADALAERDRLRAELRRREAELLRLRDLIERLHRGRRAERDFNRDLRTQLQREHSARGTLDDPGVQGVSAPGVFSISRT